ncbi:MAG: PepSY-like domain-containing protein [Bacteroidales bacterium]|nr:PepSY-like domain-containing protein [Bacteroidales bacterium]
MKKAVRLLALITLATALFATNPLFAQKLKPDAVPDDVKQTMEFEYPNVKITSWELNGGNYVANFKEDNAPGKCFINKEGKWLKTVYPVPKTELPSSITDYVKTNFANYEISVSQLQEMQDVRIHYYIEARPEGVGMEASVMTFNEVGNLMDRKDPANFDKEARTVIDPVSAAAAAARAAKPSEDNKAAAAKPAAKGSSTTSKSTASAGSKSTSTTGKPASSSSTASKSANTSAKPASTSASSNSKSTASAGSKSTSTTGKPASSTSSASKSTGATQKPAATAQNKTEQKSKKEKEVKPVYDERGNKAIDANSVPAAVKTAFAKKVQRPEELNWFRVDTFYVGNCIAREQKNEVFITPSGKWEKTYIVVPEESISGNMLKHIQTYYKGYRFKNAIKEIRADKQDVTMVEIYEKANWKQKLITTFFFDKTGKLLRTVDPNYELGGQAKESEEDVSLEKYYEKMNMSNRADDDSQIPKDVIAAFKAKYPNVKGVTWSETEDGSYRASYYSTRGKEICCINSYGVITQTMTLGNLDNLLSSISSYVKQNHKGFKVVEYYAVKNLVEKKNCYLVNIENKKTKESKELLFTTQGKFVE